MGLLKNYPRIGKAIYRLRKQFLPSTLFKSSDSYWKNRYAAGGNSGPGSYDRLAEWKAEILNRFVEENEVQSVIELGCGDGNQLTYFNFPSYTGLDISRDAIQLCQSKFKNDSTKSFHLTQEFKDIPHDLVISLDVLYHLIEEDIYHSYLRRLFGLSQKFVIIYAFDSDTDYNYGPHVKPRKFTNWVTNNRPDFKLLKHIPNKYPPSEDNPEQTSFADFFIYQKLD